MLFRMGDLPSNKGIRVNLYSNGLRGWFVVAQCAAIRTLAIPRCTAPSAAPS